MVVKAKMLTRRWQGKPPDTPILTFEHVSFSGWGKTILKDVSFRLMRGQAAILLGTSGSGKSQVLKLADGLIQPDAGCVRLFDQSIGSMPEEQLLHLRAHVGMLFQEDALFDSLSVRDNIAYELIQSQVPDSEINQRVQEALSFVDLAGSSASFPSELSGGMQRRVAFARAIMSDPDLLLYDSPTGGLDPVTAATIVDLIIRQRDMLGSSSLMVTERLQDAFRMSTHSFNPRTNQIELLASRHEDRDTRYLFLENGSISLDGSIFDLLKSQNPVIQEFLA